MKFFDEKFKNNKLRYILQCLLATIAVFLVLLTLDTISNAVIIAALGASSFIAFTMPEAQVSRPRFLIGGYLVGISAGCLCHGISLIPGLSELSLVREFSQVIFGAAAVGLAIFLMVITDTEHPPAAGLSLGLILNECNFQVVILVLIGIISLTTLKFLLRPFLKNLL